MAMFLSFNLEERYLLGTKKETCRKLNTSVETLVEYSLSPTSTVLPSKSWMTSTFVGIWEIGTVSFVLTGTTITMVLCCK